MSELHYRVRVKLNHISPTWDCVVTDVFLGYLDLPDDPEDLRILFARILNVFPSMVVDFYLMGDENSPSAYVSEEEPTPRYGEKLFLVEIVYPSDTEQFYLALARDYKEAHKLVETYLGLKEGQLVSGNITDLEQEVKGSDQLGKVLSMEEVY